VTGLSLRSVTLSDVGIPSLPINIADVKWEVGFSCGETPGPTSSCNKNNTGDFPSMALSVKGLSQTVPPHYDATISYSDSVSTSSSNGPLSFGFGGLNLGVTILYIAT
jgi:hypothetical protein